MNTREMLIQQYEKQVTLSVRPLLWAVVPAINTNKLEEYGFAMPVAIHELVRQTLNECSHCSCSISPLFLDPQIGPQSPYCEVGLEYVQCADGIIMYECGSLQSSGHAAFELAQAHGVPIYRSQIKLPSYFYSCEPDGQQYPVLKGAEITTRVQLVRKVHWYYWMKDGRKVGPVTQQWLQDCVKDGLIDQDTWVENSLSAKGHAGQVKGLRFDKGYVDEGTVFVLESELEKPVKESSDSELKWYYWSNGGEQSGRIGPLPFAQIARMIDAGTIKPGTFLDSGNQDETNCAKDIPCIRGLFNKKKEVSPIKPSMKPAGIKEQPPAHWWYWTGIPDASLRMGPYTFHQLCVMRKNGKLPVGTYVDNGAGVLKQIPELEPETSPIDVSVNVDDIYAVAEAAKEIPAQTVTWCFWLGEPQKSKLVGPWTSEQLVDIAGNGVINPETWVKNSAGFETQAKNLDCLNDVMPKPVPVKTTKKRKRESSTDTQWFQLGKLCGIGCFSALVLLVVIIGVVSSMSGNSRNTNSAVQQEIVDFVATESNCVKSTSLVSAYDNNKVSADASYKGKVFCVYGVVDRVGSDAGKSYVVFRSGKGTLFTTQCYFDKDQEGDFMSVSSGQALALVGVGDGAFGNIHMKHCRIYMQNGRKEYWSESDMGYGVTGFKPWEPWEMADPVKDPDPYRLLRTY